MKYLSTYKLFEAKKSKVKENPTEYFTMEHILDILQDFVDDGKVDIPSDPERHGYNPRQTNPYWTSLRFLKTIDCLQTYVNGKQYVSWQTFDEVRQTLEKWNVKNCFGNSDKDWRSEYYIYNPIIEQSFAKLVGECKAYPSGDNIATFYVGKGDVCHFIAVNNGEESEYQIGSNKHFLISSQIWDHFTSVYCLDTKSTQRLLKHLVGRYFNLKMDGNLMWPDKYGYVIDKKDTQKIYRENMGIDETLKTYESSYWIPKRDLVSRLNRLASNFNTYVSEYNDRTKMNHNLSFTYANLETRIILDIMKSLTVNSLDAEIKSICYEAYLLKKYREKNDNIDRIREMAKKNINSQAALHYEYYKLGDTVENLVKGTVWDFKPLLPVKEITQEQIDDLDDLIRYNDYEEENIRIIGYSLRGLSKTTSLRIDTEAKRGYKFSDKNLMSMLSGIFGGAIIVNYSSYDGKVYIYLPFVTVSREDINVTI